MQPNTGGCGPLGRVQSTSRNTRLILAFRVIDGFFRYYDGKKEHRNGEPAKTWSIGSNKKTHTKNYLFSFYNMDTNRSEYVTITGSTNGKDDAYNSKANNQLVIVETLEDGVGGALPPIYDEHKALFYKSF